MTESPFERFFETQEFVVLDGGLATALEAAGHRLESSLWSARLLIDAPDAIRAVHLAYLEAGADCITTASYQASFEGFAAAGLDDREAEVVLRRSVEIAREVRDAFWAEPANRAGRLRPIVAASAGPYGAYLADGSEYDGRYGVGRATLREFHRRRLLVLAGAQPDLVAFETIPSLAEAEAIAELLGDLAATQAPWAQWVWVSFTCRDGERLWDGSLVTDAVRAVLTAPRLAAVGVNCTAPRHVSALVAGVRSLTDLPVIAYPNSGEVYDVAARRWTGSAAGGEWSVSARDWYDAGARVLGGCCRVGPLVIRDLRAELESRRAHRARRANGVDGATA
jgi:homocysteine S-methyltransferase